MPGIAMCSAARGRRNRRKRAIPRTTGFAAQRTDARLAQILQQIRLAPTWLATDEHWPEPRHCFFFQLRKQSHHRQPPSVKRSPKKVVFS
ncbi:hypothetical protein BD777DRAFT_126894 [Yarrowia lipolytica]|nr:hypothetical protein BD777DRAFT_126894 [Yarrowia lipolytica]